MLNFSIPLTRHRASLAMKVLTVSEFEQES